MKSRERLKQLYDRAYDAIYDVGVALGLLPTFQERMRRLWLKTGWIEVRRKKPWPVAAPAVPTEAPEPPPDTRCMLCGFYGGDLLAARSMEHAEQAGREDPTGHGCAQDPTLPRSRSPKGAN